MPREGNDKVRLIGIHPPLRHQKKREHGVDSRRGTHAEAEKHQHDPENRFPEQCAEEFEGRRFTREFTTAAEAGEGGAEQEPKPDLSEQGSAPGKPVQQQFDEQGSRDEGQVWSQFMDPNSSAPVLRLKQRGNGGHTRREIEAGGHAHHEHPHADAAKVLRDEVPSSASPMARAETTIVR